MAEVFEHPLSVIYDIGKALVVNGFDIFGKLNSAIISYKEGDYFTFGKFIGEALDEVFWKNPEIKKPLDEKAYEFLHGYFVGI